MPHFPHMTFKSPSGSSRAETERARQAEREWASQPGTEFKASSRKRRRRSEGAESPSFRTWFDRFRLHASALHLLQCEMPPCTYVLTNLRSNPPASCLIPSWSVVSAGEKCQWCLCFAARRTLLCFSCDVCAVSSLLRPTLLLWWSTPTAWTRLHTWVHLVTCSLIVSAPFQLQIIFLKSDTLWYRCSPSLKVICL